MDTGNINMKVEAARAGDHDAFRWLVKRHQGLVFGICYRLTGNVHDAEDLAHESFVEAYVKLGTLREPATFTAWLRTLTLNLCRMWYRQQKRNPVEFWEQLPPAPAETDAGTTAAELPSLFAGLGQLSLTHRLALVLHYLEGLSYDQIATFLDVPIGTVMSRLHRARKELRRKVENLRDVEEIPMMNDDGFRKEVDAEIALLLEMFHEEPNAMDRLSVILKRCPERLQRVVQEPTGEATQENLAVLLPRLGAEAIGIVLDASFDAGPRARTNALAVLRHFVTRCRSECRGIGSKLDVGLGDVASFDSYVLVDRLIARAADQRDAAGLLLDLMQEAEDLSTGQLLSEALLCHGEPAYQLLVDRFWGLGATEDVYRRSNWVVQSLRNTGTRFLLDLAKALQAEKPGTEALALAGTDALARGVCEHLQRDEQPSVPGARFINETTDPELVSLVQLETATIDNAADQAARFVSHPVCELRSTAIRVLERLRSSRHIPAIRPCLSHSDCSTRVRAIQALADLGDVHCVEQLTTRARDGEPAERRAAVAALGRLRVTEARELLTELVSDPDTKVRNAAVIALGELGRDAARPVLEELLSSPDKRTRRAAASALYGMDRDTQGRGRAGRRRHEPRYGSESELDMADTRRVHHISADAAIRALPELRAYDDREITERISQVCGDWATTRRKLIEHRLMRRDGSRYEFTALGAAVWRVEHFIVTHYLRG